MTVGTMGIVSLYVRTDFGPGGNAKFIWTFCSILSFSLMMTVSKQWASGQISSTLFLVFQVFGVLFFTASALLGQAIAKRHQPREQAKRDIRARQIIEAARIHKEPDFSLFLRAFETTGRMQEVDREFQSAPGLDPRAAENKVKDFERVLAEAVENSIPLVALGRPGEQIGAGRIETAEQNWKEQIELLANAAVVIFLFPSTRPGTLWETDWLVKHALLKKTIFVMPPKTADRRNYDWATIWPQLAVAMRERGIEFPSYDSSGALFALGKDLRVSVSTRLHAGGFTRFMMKDILNQINGMTRQLERHDATVRGQVDSGARQLPPPLPRDLSRRDSIHVGQDNARAD